MRTAVYIDGFNLYFGCLKRARHCRWLDVEKLARLICVENNPSAEFVSVKYFTAPIKEKLSPHGANSRTAQGTYLRALNAHCPTVQTILGKYFIVPGSYYADSNPVDFTRKYRVLRGEEKHTDVNIALHMLADATDGIVDQQVLFTNDSDCSPILEMIKTRHPEIRIGVVPPILDSDVNRHASNELKAYSDWSRRPISESLLVGCQLPEKVPTRKKTLRRPERWTKPKLTLVGTWHQHQQIGGNKRSLAEPEQFRLFLLDLAGCLQPDLIAEEFSESAIEMLSLEDTVPKRLAGELGVSHLFCDMSYEERIQRGIADWPSYLQECFLEDVVPQSEKDYQARCFEVRENYWLARLASRSFANCLMIVGSKHTETFPERASNAGYEVSVHEVDWMN